MKVANFNFSYDLSPVILWQYQETTNLKGLVQYQQTFLDTAITEFVGTWNKNFLNLQTATTDGLAVWGQLLGVPRPLYQNAEGETVVLTDDAYRLLLQARVYLLTFDGSAKALNNFFKILFPKSQVVIQDNYNMTVSIQFLDGIPEGYEILFRAPFVDTFLPRPSGVQYLIGSGTTDWEHTFGFEGQETAGFDNGTFYQ